MLWVAAGAALGDSNSIAAHNNFDFMALPPRHNPHGAEIPVAVNRLYRGY